MSKTKVIIGEKYGRLTPIEVVGRNKHGLLLYKCVCDCGNTKIIGSRYLTDGKTVSCGCKRGNGTHNGITYKSWITAKQRCNNPNNHNYANYGGRGIKVCDRWLHSFENFLEDMGERPSKEYTLDRIDVNGNYEPSNCKWSNHIEQANNRRDCHYIIDVDGEKITISQFSRKHNLNLSNVFYELRNRLNPSDIIEKYNKKSHGTESKA